LHLKQGKYINSLLIEEIVLEKDISLALTLKNWRKLTILISKILYHNFTEDHLKKLEHSLLNKATEKFEPKLLRTDINRVKLQKIHFMNLKRIPDIFQRNEFLVEINIQRTIETKMKVTI